MARLVATLRGDAVVFTLINVEISSLPKLGSGSLEHARHGATARLIIPAPNGLFAVNLWLDPVLPAHRVEVDFFDNVAESVVAGPVFFTANLPVESGNDPAPMHVLGVTTGKPQRLLPSQ